MKSITQLLTSQFTKKEVVSFSLLLLCATIHGEGKENSNSII